MSSDYSSDDDYGDADVPMAAASPPEAAEPPTRTSRGRRAKAKGRTYEDAASSPPDSPDSAEALALAQEEAKQRSAKAKRGGKGKARARGKAAAATATPSIVSFLSAPPGPAPLPSDIHLPLRVGDITVHSLGTLQPERDNFHGRAVLLPVGFTISRKLPSCVSAGLDAVYVFRVTDGGDFPSYEATCADHVQEPIVHGTATAVWTDLLQSIHTVNGTPKPPRPQAMGNAVFGLTDPTIRCLLERLPGSTECARYVPFNADANSFSSEEAESFSRLLKETEAIQEHHAFDKEELDVDESYIMHQRRDIDQDLGVVRPVVIKKKTKRPGKAEADDGPAAAKKAKRSSKGGTETAKTSRYAGPSQDDIRARLKEFFDAGDMELKNLEKRRAVEAKLRKGIWEREKMIEEERREKEAQLQREREERERLRQQETEEERALREKREDEEFEAHLLRKYGVEDLEVEDAPPLVVGEPIIWPRRPLPDDITEPEASALLGEALAMVSFVNSLKHVLGFYVPFTLDTMDDILFGRDESAYHKAFSLNKAMLHMLLKEDAINKIEVTAWLQAMPIELHNFQGMLEQYLLSQTIITMEFPRGLKALKTTPYPLLHPAIKMRFLSFLRDELLIAQSLRESIDATMEEAAGSQRETSSIQTLMDADLQDLEEGRLSGRTRLEKAEARASTKALSLMLVNAIIEHRSTGGRPLYLVFHQLPPVEELPTYYERIKQPVDLVTIETRIYQNAYSNYQACLNDAMLMWENAMTFNSSNSQIYTDAVELRNVTIKASRQILEQYEQNKAKAVAYLHRLFEEMTQAEEDRAEDKRNATEGHPHTGRQTALESPRESSEQAASGDGTSLGEGAGSGQGEEAQTPADADAAAMDTAPDAPSAAAAPTSRPEDAAVAVAEAEAGQAPSIKAESSDTPSFAATTASDAAAGTAGDISTTKQLSQPLTPAELQERAVEVSARRAISVVKAQARQRGQPVDPAHVTLHGAALEAKRALTTAYEERMDLMQQESADLMASVRGECLGKDRFFNSYHTIQGIPGVVIERCELEPGATWAAPTGEAVEARHEALRRARGQDGSRARAFDDEDASAGVVHKRVRTGTTRRVARPGQRPRGSRSRARRRDGSFRPAGEQADQDDGEDGEDDNDEDNEDDEEDGGDADADAEDQDGGKKKDGAEAEGNEDGPTQDLNENSTIMDYEDLQRGLPSGYDAVSSFHISTGPYLRENSVPAQWTIIATEAQLRALVDSLCENGRRERKLCRHLRRRLRMLQVHSKAAEEQVSKLTHEQPRPSASSHKDPALCAVAQYLADLGQRLHERGFLVDTNNLGEVFNFVSWKRHASSVQEFTELKRLTYDLYLFTAVERMIKRWRDSTSNWCRGLQSAKTAGVVGLHLTVMDACVNWTFKAKKASRNRSVTELTSHDPPPRCMMERSDWSKTLPNIYPATVNGDAS